MKIYFLKIEKLVHQNKIRLLQILKKLTNGLTLKKNQNIGFTVY